MIHFYNQVPSVYTSASRDFQYLSWLINIVLNDVKHNVNGLYDLPNATADARLTELLAMTLGFKVKRNYDQAQLAALVNVLPSVLRYKGTKKAVAMAALALINASGTIGDFDEDIHCKLVDGAVLEVTLPKDLVDATLFTDLLPYILPAGISCRIVRKTDLIEDYKTDLLQQDVLYIDAYKDYLLSGLYNPGSDTPEFSKFDNYGIYQVGDNYIKPGTENDSHLLNVGLMDGSIIPAITNGLATVDVYGPVEVDPDNTNNNESIEENCL